MSEESPWYFFDADLVRRAQQEDPEALEAFGLKLLQVANAFVRSRCRIEFRGIDAEEAVGRVYEKTVKYLPSFRGDAAFHTFLGRIIYNELVSMVRQREARGGEHLTIDTASDDDTPPLIELLSGRSDTALSVTLADAMLIIEQEIIAIQNPLHCTCIEMWVEGYCYSEIVAATGLSLGGVSATIFRIRERIKIQLGMDFLEGLPS